MSEVVPPNASDPVIVEQAFQVSPDKVWDAITIRDQMVQWFFEEIPEFEPEVGFETRFNIDTGEREFLHLWKITEAVPQRRIVYDWRYKDCPGIGRVEFDIIPDESGCTLRITNYGLESFPNDVPEFTRESCQNGWEYFLKDQLKNFLASN